MNNDDVLLQFRTKSIVYCGSNVKILLQRAHGPCPFLALANCLLCQGDIIIPNTMNNVNGNYLIKLLNNYLSNKYINETNEHIINCVNKCKNALPKLLKGLDVNLSFGSCIGFEETIEYMTFNLMGIRLMHGWLVDPEDIDLYSTIQQLTYDECTSLATQAPNISVATEYDLNKMETHERDGYLCKLWIESTGHTQLTEHGLSQLYNTLKNDEVVVFYRNHHFFTLTKYDHSLFLLVNDDALANCHDVIWESMIEVEHRGIYVDCNFNPLSNAAKKRIKRARLVEQQRQLLEQYEQAHQRKLSSPKRIKSPISSISSSNNEEKSDVELVNTNKSSSQQSINVLIDSNSNETPYHNNDINEEKKVAIKLVTHSPKVNNFVPVNDDDDLELKLDIPAVGDREFKRHMSISQLHQQLQKSNSTRKSLLHNNNNNNNNVDDDDENEKKNMSNDTISISSQHYLEPSKALKRHHINVRRNNSIYGRFQIDRTLAIVLGFLFIFVGLIIYAIVAISN